METQGGDFARCAVDLMVVVAIELGTKDLSAVLDHCDVFPGAGADDPILEPRYLRNIG